MTAECYANDKAARFEQFEQIEIFIAADPVDIAS
jgi:hypothetical protein